MSYINKNTRIYHTNANAAHQICNTELITVITKERESQFADLRISSTIIIIDKI